jgi:hypothetical protein
LEKTVNPDLQKGFNLLQASSLLVVGFGKVKECSLVPRNAFISALSLPIAGFFLEPPKNNWNDNQKLLVENSSWDEILQTGYFTFNKFEKAISWVGWEVSLWEDVVKEFRDGRKIDWDAYTTVELYPILLLGGGDTKWVSCAIGKENMARQHHYNHCQQSTKDFIQGLGEPWPIKKIKTLAGHYQNRLLPAAAHLKTKPAGYLGVKNHLMYLIPIHFWGCPILHDELGLVKDWLTWLENFADCWAEIVSANEVATREHLVICTNNLNDFLF